MLLMLICTFALWFFFLCRFCFFTDAHAQNVSVSAVDFIRKHRQPTRNSTSIYTPRKLSARHPLLRHTFFFLFCFVPQQICFCFLPSLASFCICYAPWPICAICHTYQFTSYSHHFVSLSISAELQKKNTTKKNTTKKNLHKKNRFFLCWNEKISIFLLLSIQMSSNVCLFYWFHWYIIYQFE